MLGENKIVVESSMDFHKEADRDLFEMYNILALLLCNSNYHSKYPDGFDIPFKSKWKITFERTE